MRDTLLTRGCDIPRGAVGGWTGGACRGAEDAGVGQDVGQGGLQDASRRDGSHRCGAVSGKAVAGGAGLIEDVVEVGAGWCADFSRVKWP